MITTTKPKFALRPTKQLLSGDNIFNSGTSEGVKKSWDTREGHSNSAMLASRRSDFGNESDHRDAMNEHAKAADAHHYAASQANDNSLSHWHKAQADAHGKMVVYHKSKSGFKE